MKRTISLIQMQVTMGNPAANFSHAQQLMETAMKERPDILVLPETWNVGFFPADHLAQLADPEGKETKAFLSSFAKEHQVSILGGTVAVSEGNQVYNRSYGFDETGKLVSTYDKIHGFSLSGEPEYFQMGHTIPHFQMAGLSCSLAICYDVRFPELIRREALQGVDLFFLPAAWPKLRKDHWITLNKARAIENQFYLACVNQGGVSGNTDYAGNSMLLDPWGNALCHLPEEEAISIGTIDTDVISEVRTKINTYRDRRPEIDRV